MARAHRVVDALKAGTVWIKHYNLCPVEIPFGGVNNPASAARIHWPRSTTIPS